MSDDLELLAASFAEMLGSEWPRERAVAFASEGRPLAEELWQQMAVLGWTALTVPEAHGGLGLGCAATAQLHLALGRAVAPVPMLGTTLAVELLTRAASDAQRSAWLPGLAEGSTRAAFAAPDSEPLDARSGTVSGKVPDLLDAPAASHLFLRAARGGETGWLVVAADGPGVAVEPIAVVDPTRMLGTVSLTGASGEFIPAPAAAEAALVRVAMLSIAAEAQGGGEAVLATTIDYMKQREQFGMPIGSFQALKHRVADHQTALNASRELLEHAAGMPEDHPQALLYALSAKQHATSMTAEIARDSIQLHGGVGFTVEFVPHLYLKRAKVNECLWGTRAEVLDRIADLLEAA